MSTLSSGSWFSHDKAVAMLWSKNCLECN
jgi:hypothetical protein